MKYINFTATRKDGSTFKLANKAQGSVIKEAYQIIELQGKDVIHLTIETSVKQNYRIGDKIVLDGRPYFMNRPPHFEQTSGLYYIYYLEYEGVHYNLARVTYDLNIDTTNNELQDFQGDTLIGDLRIFADVLIANANRVFPEQWRLGECPGSEVKDKMLTFAEDSNCLSVLQTLCSEFNVEYEVKSIGGINTINFKEKIGNQLDFTFEYGKGKGLYSVRRNNVDSSNVITRLKAYGSNENITSKYRADRLCLPGKNKANSYIQSDKKVEQLGLFEFKKYFDVKPTFTGKVTAVGAFNIYQFEDTSMFDLNKLEEDGETTSYLMPGVSAKVHFNTGNLAGYEFNVRHYDTESHVFTINKFEDANGFAYPNNDPAFRINVGDEYKILDVALPQQYVENAEERLHDEALKFYNENSQPRVNYDVEVSPEYLESNSNWDGQRDFILAGDTLNLIDRQNDFNGLIRIKSVRRELADDYSYSLSLAEVRAKINTPSVLISVLSQFENLARGNNNKLTNLLQLKADTEDVYTRGDVDLKLNEISSKVNDLELSHSSSTQAFVKHYNSPTRQDEIASSQHKKGEFVTVQFFNNDGVLCYPEIYATSESVRWEANRAITGYLVIK